MFAVNVQSVSVQQMNSDVISQFTQTSNRFAVVHVVKISNIRMLFHGTLRDVLIGLDLLVSSVFGKHLGD